MVIEEFGYGDLDAAVVSEFGEVTESKLGLCDLA